MERPFVIREATKEEHEPLGRLLVAAYAGLEGFPGPDVQPAYYAMLRDIGALTLKPETKLLVAVRNGDVLGGVVYIADMKQYGAGGLAHTEQNASAFRLLATAPQARGAGVGRALANACIDEAKRHGHEQVILHTTHAMRIAWGMYERLGFVRAPDLDFDQQGLPVFGFRLHLERVT